ncbi:MAG: sensor histidine kinase [Dissulfurispiraceae bacterium]
MSRLLHLLLQGFFTIFAGYRVNRERKIREQTEKERHLARTGQVATTIVHDLNNPIITILGLSTRIKDRKGDVDEAIDIVMNSALIMQKIVQDVLDFSKPLRLTLKQEDIRDVIAGAYQFCDEKAKEGEVHLSVEVPTQPIYVDIDGIHMERALINLLGNAIEASVRGQDVRVVTVPGKDTLTITKVEQGPGMDRKTIENIFTPLYTTKKDGKGLGMPIAKKVVEAHKGKIHVDSQLGVGTSVRIELPYQGNK